MAIGELHVERSPAVSRRRRAQYALWGEARSGGAYNSHLVSIAVFAALAFGGLISTWLAAWLLVCFVAALRLDERPWQRKINLLVLPGQMFLYAQLWAQAALDALPFYALAFVLYVASVRYLEPLNLTISSFVVLYSIFMALRTYWLARSLWLVRYRWEDAGAWLAVREANLRTPQAAAGHLAWSYFLGNIGLVIRCGIQVVTIAGFEGLRQRLDLDLTRHATAAAQLPVIFAGAVAIWGVTLWPAIKRALLIYYRVHRTLHENRALYSCIHGIHHRGVLPTPLDSGTISPAEFWMTEMAIPAITLLPNWYFCLVQLALGLFGHWPSHDARTHWASAQHHLHHHRLFRVNLGLRPAEDKEFGTLYPPRPAAAS